MPPVLTQSDKLACLFLGTVSPDGSKLEVSGGGVLTVAGTAGKSVTGCAPTPPSSPPPPCSAVTSVTAGQAVKLMVGGSPALLVGMIASTDQTAALPAHVVQATTGGQSKLVAS